jgi:hypothetical protein
MKIVTKLKSIIANKIFAAFLRLKKAVFPGQWIMEQGLLHRCCRKHQR